MIGKGSSYKSFKEIEVGSWVWVNVPGPEFGSVTQDLVKVIRKVGSRPVVKLKSGGEMEIGNPKALSKALGTEGMK